MTDAIKKMEPWIKEVGDQIEKIKTVLKDHNAVLDKTQDLILVKFQEFDSRITALESMAIELVKKVQDDLPRMVQEAKQYADNNFRKIKEVEAEMLAAKTKSLVDVRNVMNEFSAEVIRIGTRLDALEKK